ncbi:hypothetical protein [Lentzea sp. NPDC003310]|uniref:hypothetical protein n=1 Tax=Lentzea sp. NPDC003310 TaxID=3154447 RepID=UPI0033A2B765
MVFHDHQQTQKTSLIEDDVPRVLRLERLRHKRNPTDDRYSHVTESMISRMLGQLQHRQELEGGWSWISEVPDKVE